MTDAEIKNFQGMLANYGCIACRIDDVRLSVNYPYPPAQIHHVKLGGEFRREWFILPLCPGHHKASTAMVLANGPSIHDAKKRFRDRYGSEYELFCLLRTELLAVWPSWVDAEMREYIRANGLPMSNSSEPGVVSPPLSKPPAPPVLRFYEDEESGQRYWRAANPKGGSYLVAATMREADEIADRLGYKAECL